MVAGLAITRTEHTSAELRALSGRCSDGAQVRHLLALALVLDGHARTEAAALSGMDVRPFATGYRYNEQGVEGLNVNRRPNLTHDRRSILALTQIWR